MKIAIIGGHLTPALAYIEYCQQNELTAELFFLGRTFSQSNQQQKSIEKKSVQSLNIPFFAIDTPKITSWMPWLLLIFLVEYLVSIQKIIKYLFKIKPDCILSFGSYLAVPTTVIGKILRIPIVTHEQTITAGRANRFIALFATKVAISFKESMAFFPQKKTVVTGNPIRPTLISPTKEKPKWLITQSKKPILYITGGNQGSHIINSVAKQILRQLTKDFVVIHGCGRKTKATDYEQELLEASRKLPSTHHGRYFVRTWITTEELSWILNNSVLAISRAGANSIQEFVATQLPALLVPLPFSFHNEQMLNAKAMAELGGAVVIAQKDFSPDFVLHNIKQMFAKHKAMKRKLKMHSFSTLGAKNLHQTVRKVIKSKK
jgi:UDP-N-acetylglucosamine--N-acetylmuramyl-(pentapeptide) pyrophosphoryl-undecaprenol N-acetylglucosamine transferase